MHFFSKINSRVAMIIQDSRVSNTGTKPLQCKICTKAFTSCHYLKIHKWVHTGSNVQNFYKSFQNFYTKLWVNYRLFTRLKLKFFTPSWVWLVKVGNLSWWIGVVKVGKFEELVWLMLDILAENKKKYVWLTLGILTENL